jgi:hypothetical protein
MAGHDVDHEMTKENDQAATIINNSDAKATINNNNLPLPGKSNNKVCVVVVDLECMYSTNTWRRKHTAFQMRNTCVTKKGKCELTLLCILQGKPIPGLTWDLNAEMIEKSISSKCIRAYKNTLYITYRRNFDCITYMI